MSSYIDWYHSPRDTYLGYSGEGCRHSWTEHTERNLAFHYGPELASSKMAGTDPATKADLAAWNALGRRQGDAA